MKRRTTSTIDLSQLAEQAESSGYESELYANGSDESPGPPCLAQLRTMLTEEAKNPGSDRAAAVRKMDETSAAMDRLKFRDGPGDAWSKAKEAGRRAADFRAGVRTGLFAVLGTIGLCALVQANWRETACIAAGAGLLAIGGIHALAAAGWAALAAFRAVVKGGRVGFHSAVLVWRRFRVRTWTKRVERLESRIQQHSTVLMARYHAAAAKGRYAVQHKENSCKDHKKMRRPLT